MSSPKLAIIRGPNLNKWDMQFYEPLIGRYDITAFGSQSPNFDLSEILFPIIQLPSNPEAMSHLIGLERGLAYRGFDLICTADFVWTFSLQAMKAKEIMKNTKVVVYSSEIHPFICEENKIYSENKEIVRQNADMIIAATERAKETFLVEGIPEEKIAVVNRGVDTKRFYPRKEDIARDRNTIGIDNNKFVILFIGRYDDQKGISDLVFAAKKLSMDRELNNIPLLFLMVGKGPCLEKIKGFVEKLGLLSKFQFIEEYPYTEIHKLHNLADMLVLPSTIIPGQTQERFGMVLIEAMASKTPFISTYSGAIPEVVGDTGILVPPSNFIMLADAIKEMVLNKDLREHLSSKGRKRVEERFDSNKIADKLDVVFQRVLHSEKTLSSSNKKRKSLNTPEESIKKLIREIDELKKNKSTEGIKTKLEQAARNENQNKIMPLLLAKTYMEISEWEKAEEQFREIKGKYYNLKILYYTGICMIKLDKTDEAITFFNDALKQDSTPPVWRKKIMVFIGKIYLKNNQLEKSGKIFEELLRSYSKDEESFLHLGEILWRMGKREEGLQKTAMLLKINIENRPALYLLVKRACELKKLNVAKEYLGKYLEYHPLDLDVLFELGKVFHAEKKDDQCREILEKILIFHKDHTAAKELFKKIALRKAV
jgi:alpha-maltose-1-phosphate synthase